LVDNFWQKKKKNYHLCANEKLACRLESKSYFIDRGLKYTFVEGSWEENKFSWVWKSSMTRCFEREGYDVHCTLTDVSF
jgi:hypothetical protein